MDLFGFGNNSSGDEDAKGKPEEDEDEFGYFPLKPKDQPSGRRTTNLSDLAVTGQSSIESGSLFDSPDLLKPPQRRRKITWHGDNDPIFPGTPTSSRGGKLMTGGSSTAATGNIVASAVNTNHQQAIA